MESTTYLKARVCKSLILHARILISDRLLQPTFIKLGTTVNPTSLLQLGYEYTGTCQSGNNGNVLRQTITAPNTVGGSVVLTQDYCYDSLNRLSSASENSGVNWSQTYGYDRYGNRWVNASPGYALSLLTPTSSAAFNASTNRLVAPSQYDNSGNQTVDAQSRTFSYDAENRQITFNGTVGQYFYDGDGHRVKKIDGNGTTVFVYNAGGQLIAEYHSDPVPPAAGGGGTSYLTSDHLGSTRVVTKQDGTVKARYDYLPFGEEIPSTVGGRSSVVGYGAADSTRQKFTQKERDSESGLDYFGARYYSSAQGRFTSADEPLIGSYMADPQSWNLFSYARNNPLLYRDLTGRDYDIYDKDGKLVRRVTDAELSTLQLSDTEGSSEDGSTIHLADGSVGHFVDVPTGDTVDTAAGFFPIFTLDEQILAGAVARTIDENGVLPDPRFDPFRLPWNPPRPIHYSELHLGEPSVPIVFCGGLVTCQSQTLVGIRGAPLQEEFVRGSNVRTTIGGRQFSGHALDRMQQYGLVPSVIENAIANGTSSPGNTPGTTRVYDPVNRIDVILDSASGRVITTGPRKLTYEQKGVRPEAI